ncbi:hypothetical protein TNCV_685191 [Trichonephila clavipes]|nr:hypothetical protein TNCV_685191 [Trichonephila clavipes]
MMFGGKPRHIYMGHGRHMQPIDVSSEIPIFWIIQPKITFDHWNYLNHDLIKAESRMKRGPGRARAQLAHAFRRLCLFRHVGLLEHRLPKWLLEMPKGLCSS